MVTDLSSSAREREVLAAVADGIVTAAEGRDLRVAVAGSPSQLAFAGQLTRALHARGRACRCLAPVPGGSPDRPEAQAADGPAIAVIVGNAQAAGDGEVCGLRIRITVYGREPAPDQASRATESHRDGDSDSDIVIDYSDPDGPTIRQFSVPGVGSTAPPAALVEHGEMASPVPPGPGAVDHSE